MSLIRLLCVVSPILLCYQNEICGIWLEEEKRSHIEIYKNNNNLYEGKIVWLSEPLDENGEPKKDKDNPNKSLRDQTLDGLIIIKDLEYVKKNEWSNGTIYDARSGKTYSLNATLNDDKNLFMRGYFGFSFIGRTTSWTRIQ